MLKRLFADAFYGPASRSGAAVEQAATHAQMRLGTAIAPSQGQMRLGTAVAPSQGQTRLGTAVAPSYAHMRLGTAVAPGTARIGTASSGEGGARPMTSNKVIQCSKHTACQAQTRLHLHLATDKSLPNDSRSATTSVTMRLSKAAMALKVAIRGRTSAKRLSYSQHCLVFRAQGTGQHLEGGLTP